MGSRVKKAWMIPAVLIKGIFRQKSSTFLVRGSSWKQLPEEPDALTAITEFPPEFRKIAFTPHKEGQKKPRGPLELFRNFSF
jgi:hypothetical protein